MMTDRLDQVALDSAVGGSYRRADQWLRNQVL